MLCDKCRRNEASVHVTKIVNGVKYEQNLCAQCAHEQASAERGHGMTGGLEQLMNFFRSLGMVGVVMAPGAVASNRLGATNIEALGLTLPSCTEGEEIQGVSIEALRAELSSAVASERYERAAELRDEIFQLEQQLNNGQN